ncbi:IS5 family transposase [Streptomyces hirsutus]
MDDELWALIEPLLPPWPERAPGPRPVDDRRCLQGILYVLHHDIAWQLLGGVDSGQTCRRRLERWQQAGVFDRLHRILPAESPGIMARASTSSMSSGRYRAATCTAVLAGGRAVSMCASRAARTSGRMATSVT